MKPLDRAKFNWAKFLQNQICVHICHPPTVGAPSQVSVETCAGGGTWSNLTENCVQDWVSTLERGQRRTKNKKERCAFSTCFPSKSTGLSIWTLCIWNLHVTHQILIVILFLNTNQGIALPTWSLVSNTENLGKTGFYPAKKGFSARWSKNVWWTWHPVLDPGVVCDFVLPRKEFQPANFKMCRGS